MSEILLNSPINIAWDNSFRTSETPQSSDVVSKQVEVIPISMLLDSSKSEYEASGNKRGVDKPFLSSPLQQSFNNASEGNNAGVLLNKLLKAYLLDEKRQTVHDTINSADSRLSLSIIESSIDHAKRKLYENEDVGMDDTSVFSLFVDSLNIINSNESSDSQDLAKNIAFYSIVFLITEDIKSQLKNPREEGIAYSEMITSGGAPAPAPMDDNEDVSLSVVNCNILGSQELVNVMSEVVIMLQKAQKESTNENSAALALAFKACDIAANSLVDAAKISLTGSVTGGVLAVVINAGAATHYGKALNNEAKSIKINLAAARTNEFNLAEHRAQAELVNSTRTNPGDHVNPGDHELEKHTKELRDTHSLTQTETLRTRVVHDFVKSLSDSSIKLSENGAGVSGAQTAKEGELARGDQAVNTEVANLFKEQTKKQSEAQDALIQTINSEQVNRNNTVSSMASNIH